MYDNGRKITIFTGNLGSGKTELAVNYALYQKDKGLRTAIVDLDIVNPYFRTRKVRDLLIKRGLEVVCPAGPLANADVPALSPAIKGVIENAEITGVFDVGGDDVGATALGRFRDMLADGSYNMYFVVNACRPFTRGPEGVVKMLRSVENACGLKVTGLVNNTNLGGETDIDTIINGHGMVKEAAGQIGVPVAFAGALKNLAGEVSSRLEDGAAVLPLTLFMRTPWQEAFDGDM